MAEIYAKYGMWIMVALWVAAMYLLIVLPNKKKQKKQKEMLDSLKEGEEIVTIGGIKGTISSVQEDYIQIRVDKGVHLTIRKSAVAVVLK